MIESEGLSAADGRWEHDALLGRIGRSAPLLVIWSRREFQVRYRQSLLGVLWSVVQPLATLAVFGGILAGIFGVGSEGHPYIAFAYAGLVAWSFASSAIGAAVPSILGAAGIGGKVYVPREVLPRAAVGACIADLLIATAVFVVILVAEGVGLSYHLVAVVVVDAVLVVWVAAAAVLGAVCTVFVRDLRHATPLVLQLAFIATPVMYPASLFPDRLAFLNDVNPMAVVIDSIRTMALEQAWPPFGSLFLHLLAGSVVLTGALAYTRSVEPRIVDVL